MLKFRERGQFILVIGLFFLVVATAISIYGVLQARETFDQQSAAIAIEAKLEHLAKKFKDWEIAILREVHVKADSNKTDRAREALEQALDDVAKSIGPDSPNFEAFAGVQKQLILLTDSAEPPHSSDTAGIQKVLDVMMHSELYAIARRGSEVSAQMTFHLSLSMITLMVAVFLIFFAFQSIRDQESKLRALKEEAESASRLKSKFLSTVSHEIRTPLNGIIGLSEILGHSNNDADRRNFARIIHQSGNTLLRLINDILDFSKIEAGKFQLTPVECSLADIADQVLFTLSPKAAQKSISLNYEIAPDLPRTVIADPDRLSQILFNLVGNAIKFTRIGGVILKISLRNGSTVVFTINDTGVGIPGESLKNLFSPFVQFHPGGTSGEPGTGLGLSISKSIVDAMGGRIQVRSQSGHGSQFEVEIPLKGRSPETIGPRPKFQLSKEIEKQSTVAAFTLPPRVLIVEDNPTNQIVAQTMLDKLGVIYAVAADGQEALEAMAKNPFDLVLMDFQMPVMDGVEATRELRRRGDLTPVIAMTANAYGEDERLCREAGMNGYLTKPLRISALENEIRAHFKGHAPVASETLDALDRAVGAEGRKKVVRSFLSTIPDFRTQLNSLSDLTSLNRLGHRFRAAALSVGGTEFAAAAARLEHATTATDISKDTLLESLTRLERALAEFAE